MRDRMQEAWVTRTLLVGMQDAAATLENSLVVSQTSQCAWNT